MFFEALQSYYSSLIAIGIFIVMIISNKLFSRRIKGLFLAETLVVLAIILATWADRCFSNLYLDGNAWKLRNIMSMLNFLISPFSPAILISIYWDNPHKRRRRLLIGAFYFPLVINAALCVVSLFNGCIFDVNQHNVYHRGPLFLVPFVIAAMYMLSLVIFSWTQTKRNKLTETIFLGIVMVATGLAASIEVIYVVRYMIWSTTGICVILYFLLLNNQWIMYDPLTGAYSRVAYEKRLSKLSRHRRCVLAMIDINDLKKVNDKEGHAKGDKVLCQATQTITNAIGLRTTLYRIGGDEFMLISEKLSKETVEKLLGKAQKKSNMQFAFGVTEYEPTQEIKEVIDEADWIMYQQKSEVKSQ